MTPNAQRSPTVAIHTHGCKLNQADSSRLARQFQQAGYQLVPPAADADVFVLNTCTVTAQADAKARQALRSAHRRNPGALIVATGCYSQRAAGELQEMDAVSLVVGNTGKESLVALVTGALTGQAETAGNVVPQPPSFGGSMPEPVPVFVPVGAQRKPTFLNAATSPAGIGGDAPAGRLRAMVKIQEGCNQVCAYCIVPKVRGRERSVSPESIIRQINRQRQEGAQEVVLTGTQLGSYGFDLPGADLVRLLSRVLAETDIPRIRVSSLQPQEISGALLRLWEDPRLCPHFHIPLQNGSDPVLRAMHRRYTAQQAARAVEKVRHAVPGAGVTTDIIVGFPGEGDAEFAESIATADALGFSDMHVFPYSVRPGTGAAFLADHVPPSEKRSRVAAMLEVSRRHFLAFRQLQQGQVKPVLWESSRRGDDSMVWSGLTDNYVRVSAKSTADLRNTITPARLGGTVGGTVMAHALP